MQCYVIIKIILFKRHNLKVRTVDKFNNINSLIFIEPISLCLCQISIHDFHTLTGQFKYCRKVNATREYGSNVHGSEMHTSAHACMGDSKVTTPMLIPISCDGCCNPDQCSTVNKYEDGVPLQG